MVSKSLDNSSSIGGTAPTVVRAGRQRRRRIGLSPFDVRRRLRFSSVYELPFRRASSLCDARLGEHVLGNWRLDDVITWQTGIPFPVLLGGNAANNSGTGSNFSSALTWGVGWCCGRRVGRCEDSEFPARFEPQLLREYRRVRSAGIPELSETNGAVLSKGRPASAGRAHWPKGFLSAGDPRAAASC